MSFFQQPGFGVPGSSDTDINRLHDYDDRDSSILAHHHTLGILPTQSSPGDHIHDGKTSKTLLAAPKGELAYTAVSTASGAITILADVPNYTISFILTSTRKIKITVSALCTSTIANDIMQLLLATSASVQQQTTQIQIPNINANPRCSDLVFRALLTAGSYSYKLRAARLSGTGTCQVNAAANNIGFILVEDMGAG